MVFFLIPRYPYFSQNAHADAGNGMLVQQAMQQSYARQTGALPPAAGAQQQAGVGQHGPNARVKWGVEATDEDFEEVATAFQEIWLEQMWPLVEGHNFLEFFYPINLYPLHYTLAIA